MSKLLLACSAFTFVSLGAGFAAIAATEPVPCENMLKDLKGAIAANKDQAVDMAKVQDLRSRP
jgi:hypothetical protein